MKIQDIKKLNINWNILKIKRNLKWLRKRKLWN